MKTISLDAMGGDYGPSVVVPAAMAMLRKHPGLEIIFVGQEPILKPFLRKTDKHLRNRWRIQHASEVVEMNEPPAQALRTKKDSSMRVAISLVKEGQAQACVSAGNTGALMAISRSVLKTFEGIDRPAIMTRFPTYTDRELRILDLGANVESPAEHLYQFGVMASILTTAIDGIAAPKVALLNIGEEEIKGSMQVKKAAALFSSNEAINYVGYIEANNIFNGTVDVVVCDGFVGNVALKACEGIVKLLGHNIRSEFKRNLWSRVASLFSLPVLKNLKAHMDPRVRNGATFLGLNGIVIKSHGSADVLAYSCAIEEALLEVEKNVAQHLHDKVQNVLAKATFPEPESSEEN